MASTGAAALFRSSSGGNLLAIFKKNPAKTRFGLVNCMNNHGLGTEPRLMRDFFRNHFPDGDFQIYQIPAGRKGKDFDAKWHNKRSFQRCLANQDAVMTIEQFMPNLFRACCERGNSTGSVSAAGINNNDFIGPVFNLGYRFGQSFFLVEGNVINR